MWHRLLGPGLRSLRSCPAGVRRRLTAVSEGLRERPGSRKDHFGSLHRNTRETLSSFSVCGTMALWNHDCKGLYKYRKKESNRIKFHLQETISSASIVLKGPMWPHVARGQLDTLPCNGWSLPWIGQIYVATFVHLFVSMTPWKTNMVEEKASSRGPGRQGLCEFSGV